MNPKNKREKVIVYSTSFFSVSETFIYNQVRALEEENEVHLLASRFVNPHNFKDDNFKKYEIHRKRGFINRVAEKFLKLKLFRLQSYQTIYKLFKRNRFKAVHAHYGTKAIEILPIAKWFKVPLVVSFHGADASRMLQYDNYVKKLPILFDYASIITISSKHMADNLKLSKWEEKVHLVPYGVDPHYFVPDSEKKETDKIKILHAGRIVGKKGVPDLIKVFQELSNEYNEIELHLAGDGDEMPQCRELVKRFGLDKKVIFYGSVKHEMVRELMDQADIFVLNSRIDEDGDMEGTPNVILEAMCMGKPVVSTKHAGIPYVIDHERNGLLSEERNNKELKDLIEILIENPDVREKLGDEARKTILDSYTIEGMKQKIKQIFETL